MPDEQVGTEEAGFADEPSPVAGLSVDAAVARWICTHAELAAALHRTRLCRYQNGPSLATTAREILAQLQEAAPDPDSARLAELENALEWHTSCTSCARVLDSAARETFRAERAEAENARLKAELAETQSQLYIAKEGAFKS
jgi:hypothetical protein